MSTLESELCTLSKSTLSAWALHKLVKQKGKHGWRAGGGGVYLNGGQQGGRGRLQGEEDVYWGRRAFTRGGGHLQGREGRL